MVVVVVAAELKNLNLTYVFLPPPYYCQLCSEINLLCLHFFLCFFPSFIIPHLVGLCVVLYGILHRAFLHYGHLGYGISSV